MSNEPDDAVMKMMLMFPHFYLFIWVPNIHDHFPGSTQVNMTSSWATSLKETKTQKLQKKNQRLNMKLFKDFIFSRLQS